MIKNFQDLIKTINNPYPITSILFILLAMKFFTPDIIYQISHLDTVKKIFPEFLIVLKAASVGMYLYGMAGALLIFICMLINGLEVLANKVDIYMSVLPGGWFQATWDILSLGVIWYWILAGYIFGLGGQPWIPKFVNDIENNTFLQMIPLIIHSFVGFVFLFSFFSNLLSPRYPKSAMRVWVVNPIELKNKNNEGG